MRYANTLNLTGQALFDAKVKAGKMEGRILEVMRKSGRWLTPWKLMDLLWPTETRPLIGSVRRALTNLTDDGLLTQSTGKVMERYGSENFQWKYYLEDKK